jgi:protein-arginine kinase activator protein McsA
MKSKEDKDDFEQAWCVCPNCNQQYQNLLRLELTGELVKFAERTTVTKGVTV